jgi:hypothetical protein
MWAFEVLFVVIKVRLPFQFGPKCATARDTVARVAIVDPSTNST